MPFSVHVRGPQALGPEVDALVGQALAVVRDVDRCFNPFRPDSELSLLNAGLLAGEDGSPQLREVTALCEQARALTGGAFDAELPDARGRRRLDPSGLLKGWAVERAAAELTLLEGHDWVVSAGSDLRVSCVPGSSWRVGVQDPADPTRLLRVLELSSGAVATSGGARAGARVVHPASGQPADGARAVTVVGDSAVWADAFATAGVVKGAGAFAWLSALPGYEAAVVERDGRTRSTWGPGARPR
nr:FAD:protein FMN transferase [Motilibacter aurantiacus]